MRIMKVILIILLVHFCKLSSPYRRITVTILVYGFVGTRGIVSFSLLLDNKTLIKCQAQVIILNT